MRTVRILVQLIGLALLAACAGGGAETPGLTPEDIVAAEQSGDLEAVYQRASGRLAAGELDKAEEARLRQVRQEVGAKLSERLGEEVRRTLAETAPALGEDDEALLPAAVLDAQRERIEPMRAWSETHHASLSNEISERTRATRSAIAEREAQLASMAADNAAGRLDVLKDLTLLAGASSEAGGAYAQQRRDVVARLNSGADRAIEAEDFDEARRLLEAVATVDPTDADTRERLADVDTKVFERDFYRSLEQGDPDSAYDLLVSISASESFPSFRPRLEPSADAMANYYVAAGAEATTAGDVPQAYARFSQARHIHEVLGEGTRRAPPEEAPFVALVKRDYDKARKGDRMGLAWGYLNVVKELSPKSPTLRRQLRETREVVLQRATKRLSVSSFETPDDTDSEFGDAVASNVVQHLFEQIPKDVRMIEREQLSDIMREKELDTQDASQLAAADFLVQGTVLEAKVDSTEKSGKQTQRVVTETVEMRNPEYDAWFALSSKERDKTPEPPKTRMAPRREDVTIEVTVHRKIGLFSVAFRLIDAQTAKVVYADSARARVEHQDNSSEGVELGDFKKEFKLASLPSDTEILIELADEVSTTIGAKLSARLAEPERTYREAAERFVEEANYEAAAQQYAYAIVLADEKGANTDAMLTRLREAAIQSSAR